MQLQHICGKVLTVAAFQSHGETILDINDPETGKQVNHCPECGEEIEDGLLFPMDFFPDVYAEMAESLVMEV